LQWLHDQSEINGDNPNNRRREAKKEEGTFEEEPAMNSKKKNIKDLYRGII
jgi:hypothetical protein